MRPPDPQARTEAPGPRVLLHALPDTASGNIARHLAAAHAWRPSGHTLDGHDILQAADSPRAHPVYLATIDDWHIRREGLGEELAAALDAPLEAVMVLSRHRAASGVPSFTAHPVGNPGSEAAAGGRPGTPTPTHPVMLSAAYRALRREAAASHLPHQVALEATHHGPESAVPIVFIEIGSDESHYEDEEAGRVVAAAAWEAVHAEPVPGQKTFMGIGSGHYVPRFSDVLDTTPAAVGHMLASYHWKDGAGVPRERLAAFLRASAPPGAARPDAVYLDKKSFNGEDRRRILADLAALEVPVVRTADLA